MNSAPLSIQHVVKEDIVFVHLGTPGSLVSDSVSLAHYLQHWPIQSIKSYAKDTNNWMLLYNCFSYYKHSHIYKLFSIFGLYFLFSLHIIKVKLHWISLKLVPNIPHSTFNIKFLRKLNMLDILGLSKPLQNINLQ